MERVLCPKLRDLTHPFAIQDMVPAVKRLADAYAEQETVALYGDFDLDGTSGLALLSEGLRGLGFENLLTYQPLRLSEGYGLHAEAIERLGSKGAGLVVTVDVGITGFDAAERASSLGLDLIITDHHQPKETLPKALAVVNPNRSDCSSGLGHLCGAGVALYLLLGLKIELQARGIDVAGFDYRELLDFFVIATLTDMVPLHRENRVLVQHGIGQLERTQRPGLRHLMNRLGLSGKKLSAQDIAVRLAPKLNALSRLEEDIRPFEVMTEADPHRAASLVDQVIATNERRIELQNAATEQAISQLRIRPPENTVFVFSETYHRGVVGLVATRLAQEFRKPAFVGAMEPDGTVIGSARLSSPTQPSLLSALEASGNFLVKFGGHDPAAGFEFRAENAEGLHAALNSFYASTPATDAREIFFDQVLRLRDLTPDFIFWFDKLSPFGAGFEEPLFQVTDLVLESVTQLRGGHRRLKIMEIGSSRRMEAVWFGPPADHALLRGQISNGEAIEILGALQWNEFRGHRLLQLLVRDVRSLESSP
jgi:single-stranded-DNA-specific exonuclease